MAHTKVTKNGTQNTGTANTFSYSGSFNVFKASEVEVELDNVALTFTTSTINESASPREYTVDFTNKEVHIGGANLASSNSVVIQPVTDMGAPTPRATYAPGASVTSDDLNNNQLQLMRKAMEYDEQKLSSRGGTMTGNLHLAKNIDITFEGDTDNNFETTLTVADPTSDKTITFPDTTGTVVTTGDTGTVATGMVADSAITTAKIAADAVTAAKIGDDVINSEHYAAGSIDTEHIGNAQITSVKILDGNVLTSKINDGAVTNIKLADDSVDSRNYVDNSIDTQHIADNQITSAKILDGNVLTSKINDGAVTTVKLADTSVTSGKLANNIDIAGTLDVTGATTFDANVLLAADNQVFTIANGSSATKFQVDTDNGNTTIQGGLNVQGGLTVVGATTLANQSIGTDEIANDAVTNAKIADDSIDSEHYVDGSIDSAHIGGAQIIAAKLASNSVTESKITDSNVTTDKIANANITLAKLASDLKQTTISDSDTQLPTSGAVVDYVAAQLEPFGGFEAIANELSFPNTQPVSGVAISIADAQGIVVNSSGVSTTGRTLNGTTVTINNIPSNFHSSTIAAGVRFIVTSTGSSQTYNYHKATLPESDLVGLSGDINDFNERYRIGSSNPTSNNDSGDLFFNTGTGKMLVYDGTSSAWEEVQSVGSFFINTISSSSATGGGSATFNNNAYRFTLSNAGTVAEQHIVSINGVIQKPNSGTSQPSEGFAMDGADIIFSAAPSSGADFFIITIGSTVNINTPSAGSVTSSTIASNAVVEAKIADGAVTNNKIASGISASKITGLSTDSITEGDSKVEVVDTGSASHVSTEIDGTLISRAFSGGSTHFKSGVFGAAHNITDGQGQAISLMYGGGTSNQGLIACTHTNGLDIQNSTSVSIGQNGFPNQDYANFTTNGATFFVGGNVKLQVNASGVTTYYSILPNADSTLNLGANATRFANVYADTYYGDGQNLTGVASTVADGCIYENSQTISNNYTISTNKNAMSAGPITIANGVTLTIPSGSVYTIV